MRRNRRLEEALAALLLGGAVAFFVVAGSSDNGSSSAPAKTSAAHIKPAAEVAAGHGYQELAALTSSHQVFRTPAGQPAGRVSATRPITGEQTVLPVLGTSSRGGDTWIQVRLPGRPNGHVGWISVTGTKLEYTSWRLVINLGKRRVYAYKADHLMRSFEAVVGARSTPTPQGDFFVEENVALKPSAVGYPYALALSSRSNVFQEFEGGPGQIALHGLDNVGGRPGTAASHGCIRLDTSDITWLAKHLNPGVPVSVI
jgi:lipoprotein-anchoring transpeptidase ErfK/SrfK